MLTGLIFLLILSVLVLIHEAGHFFVAKKLGIRVEEFGFGLPLTKALFSVKKGETTYSFYPALIGGFVKVYGEDEAGAGRIKISNKQQAISKKDEKRAFFSRPLWQRFSVIFAGVLMNTFLAVVIYYVFLGISGFRTELPLLGDHQFFAVNQENKADIIFRQVVAGSPAADAGITPFSKLISVNGQEILSVDQFTELIDSNKGSELTIAWQNTETGREFSQELTPRIDPPEGEGALGVVFFPISTAVLDYTDPVDKVFSGFTHPANLMVYNFKIIGQLIDISVKEGTAEPISQGVSGPIGIYSVVGEVLSIPDMKERVLQVLNLAGLLSISLAFFNVLPIPGLDGGRLFFLGVEAVTRKKLNPKFEAYANAIGMAVLIALIVVVTFKDIFQLFG